MSRAEEKALEAYPVDIIGHTIELAVGAEPKSMDWNENNRKSYTEGYEQAEKDLTLTWGDIQKIFQIDVELSGSKALFDKKYCMEVLRRFNEQRNK